MADVAVATEADVATVADVAVVTEADVTAVATVATEADVTAAAVMIWKVVANTHHTVLGVVVPDVTESRIMITRTTINHVVLVVWELHKIRRWTSFLVGQIFGCIEEIKRF